MAKIYETDPRPRAVPAPPQPRQCSIVVVLRHDSGPDHTASRRMVAKPPASRGAAAAARTAL